jgi:hypothetical protein
MLLRQGCWNQEVSQTFANEIKTDVPVTRNKRFQEREIFNTKAVEQRL